MRARGARSALLFYFISWLLPINEKMRVALFCSDVQKPFDHAARPRLLQKLKNKKMHSKILSLLDNLLQPRNARDIVNGHMSSGFSLNDMLYQKTVLKPPLCNVFYEDARHVLNLDFFTQAIYANDRKALNFFRDLLPMLMFSLLWSHVKKVYINGGQLTNSNLIARKKI